MKGLEGIKVVEIGGGVAAAYGTKLMADLGAEVVKIEPPEGDVTRRRGPFPQGTPDPERSGVHLYLNTNKRGVVLDLPREAERLHEAVRWADILIHDLPPARMAECGVDYDAFARLNPRLVMCSITPFGLTGPHRDYRAEEITISHGGGWGWLGPGALRNPDLPPLKAFGHQSDFQAGLAAMIASLGHYHSALDGGQGEHIDLSRQEVIASMIEHHIITYTYTGRVNDRKAPRILYPWGVFPCQDGLIFMVIVEEHQWQRLVALMGNPNWAQDPDFATGPSRGQHVSRLEPHLLEWIRTWKVQDLYIAGQTNRICMCPVMTMADLPEQEQLDARDYFVAVDHAQAGPLSQPGAPYKLSDNWWAVRKGAPTLGQDNEAVLAEWRKAGNGADKAPAATARRPLEGVRIADFSWVWAGPFGTLQLAHLGAEVIRIESHGRLDTGRRLPLYPTGMEPGPNRAAYSNQWGQGKKSMLLNLAHPRACEIARELIAKCDVVVDNFATGVMERLGLGYDALARINPDIIVASISGYGHTGPQASFTGYGPAIVNLSGLGSLTGYPGGGPEEVGISYGDPNGGWHAAAAICAALVARRRGGGKGQNIDLSLWEALAALQPEGWMDHVMNGTQPPRMGNRDPLMAPHNVYRCRGEDDWVSIACATGDEWRALAAAIGEPALATDVRFATAEARKANEDALDGLLGRWTAARDRWEITAALQAAGIAAFPSMSPKDLVEDAHLNGRGFFSRLPHPEVGVRTHMGIPWRTIWSPNGVAAPAPLLGHDTDHVMRDLLGYSADEIERLKGDQVLY